MSPKQSPSALRLRAVLIPVYLPTFILCICSAAIVNDVLPAIGLIPCTASFVSSCAIAIPAWRKKRRQQQNEDEEDTDDVLARRWLVNRHSVGCGSHAGLLVVDLAIAIVMFLILILSWTIPTWERGWYRYEGKGKIVLATYTTVPMLFVFIAHTWLAISDAAQMLRAYRLRRSTPTECPNCRARFHNSDTGIEVTEGGRPEDYTINRPSEDAPFRDTSFDSDVAIQPDQHETGTTGSKDS